MKKLGFIIFLIFIFSCSGNSEKESFSDEMSGYKLEEEIIPVTRQAEPGIQNQNIESSYVNDKKIIKDARLELEVDEYTIYRSNLDSLVSVLNAYVSGDNLDKNDYNISCNMIIRIPSQNFERFISILEKGSGKLINKNISARDVTEEFIDIEARLNTKKEVEKRYIQLLSKAKNIKEILEVEEKLRVLREEIESREGRLKYLNKQVSFSTVYLHIVQKLDYKYEPIKEKSFFQRLFKSLDKGWKGFVLFLLYLLRIWPLIIISFIAFYYIRKVKRKNKLKKQQEEAKNKTHYKPGQKRYFHNKPKPIKKENNSESNN